VTVEYDPEGLFVVIADGDRARDILPGMPTQALIDACNDGKAHEAWLREEWQWRLRDDKFDAEHMPSNAEYRLVRVGRNWER
jgi:hypothetical protein